MKKFVLTFLILSLCLIQSTAFASMEVTYNNTGAVKSITQGATHNIPVHNWGSNAAFLPKNTEMAARKSHAIQREKAMTRAMANRYRNNNSNNNLSANTVTAPSEARQVSRFNKSYTISTQKTYTKNGVTYYN